MEENMIKSINEVDIYEVDGKEDKSKLPHPRLEVVSHWNWETFVVLNIPEMGGVPGRSITVKARDLEAAIKNAQNINRHG
jgi:hypothetical protein